MNNNFRSNRSRFGNRNNSRRPFSRGRRESTINPQLFVAKNIDVTKEIVDTYVGKSFKDYNLSSILYTNLSKKGFKSTTKIQEEVIDKIVAGKNVCAISQTGSGKTGAFLIPMIEKLSKNRNEKVLIIAPTRELAKQIRDEAFALSRNINIYSTLVIGGENIYKQIKGIRRNPQIIVGTPGRLNDVYKRKILNFASFNNVILDEVDRMLDMGFVNEIKLIHELTAAKKQSLFFSATLDRRVEGIIKEMTPDFELIKLTRNEPAKSVYQDIVEYESNEQKIEKLTGILAQTTVTKTLIFVETKRYADKVGKALEGKGLRSGVIHGNKKQNQRQRILDSFKRSYINVLIATNVAARGIDIEDISHVINLDTPTSYDDYIHRIGRVGRNGHTGTAFTFVQKRYNYGK